MLGDSWLFLPYYLRPRFKDCFFTYLSFLIVLDLERIELLVALTLAYFLVIDCLDYLEAADTLLDGDLLLSSLWVTFDAFWAFSYFN